jgi:hypothetical protein
MDNLTELVEAGAWVGRQQAFALIATQSAAAQALCLKHAKESRLFERLGLTWEQFCRDHAGISRVYADSLIRRHDEFGENYFRLSALARVSPATYREIAGQVSPEAIEIGGETLPLTPEHAPRIRAALDKLRAELRSARDAAEPRPSFTVTEFRDRIDALAHEVESRVYMHKTPAQYEAMRKVVAYALNQWRDVDRHTAMVKCRNEPLLS